MGKRIEEFTAEELGEVFWGAKGHQVNDMAPVLDYIKANLDTGKREPMSVGLISRNTAKRLVYKWRDSVSDREYWTGLKDSDWTTLIDAVREAISVQQGFVPDWSKAPGLANGIAILWRVFDDDDPDTIQYIPRPAPR